MRGYGGGGWGEGEGMGGGEGRAGKIEGPHSCSLTIRAGTPTAQMPSFLYPTTPTHEPTFTLPLSPPPTLRDQIKRTEGHTGSTKPHSLYDGTSVNVGPIADWTSAHLEQYGLLPGGQIPQSGRLVPTAGGQQQPIRAEGDACDATDVALRGGGTRRWDERHG